MHETPVFAAPKPKVQGPVAGAPKKAPCPVSSPDKVSAATAARLCGGEVEVLDLRSETTQVWAQPTGDFRARAHMGPERFQDGNTWRDVDLTLQKQPDGSIAPRAHPRGLRLSGPSGNPDTDTDMITVRMGPATAAEKMTVAWQGKLPEPVLAGEKATYPDVLPGIDLVVIVTPTGFEQFIVVKTRAAAPLVRTAKLAMRPGSLAVVADATGGMLFKDKGGKVVATTPAPLMWDSAFEPASGDPKQVRKVGLSIKSSSRVAGAAGEKELRLSADEAWLTSPDRQYPVMIDPGLTSDNDTWVSTATSSSQFGSSDLKLGTWNSGGEIARSYLRWDYGPIFGKKITSATLNMWEHHAYSCRAFEWQLWSAGYIDPNTVWSNKPEKIKFFHKSSQTRGHPDCGSDGWVSIGATDFLQEVADTAYPYLTMNLVASDEYHSDSWKKFNSANAGSNRPYLDITFNEAPSISSTSTSPGTTCGADAGRPYISKLTPTLGAVASDPEGSPSNLYFEWGQVSGGALGNATVAGQPNGSGTSVPVPAGHFSEGGSYWWHVRADGGAGLVGPWSALCEFTVDTIKPLVPVVTSKDGKYPSIVTDNTWGHGGYGQAGLFTLTPAGSFADLASFAYQLDNQASPTTVATTAAIDISLSPSEDGVRELTVWAKDKAGNQSDAATYVFNVGRAGLSQPRPGANVVRRTNLGIDGDATYTRARFQYRRGPGGTVYDVPWSNTTTKGNQPVVATAGTPVALAGLGGSAVWNALDTLGSVGGVVQVRARMYGNAGFVADGSIRLPESGKCLDLYGYGTGNGTAVQMYDCHGVGNQVFELSPDRLIRNPVSGRCLDAIGGGTASGTRIHLWDCHGGPNQLFERLADGQIRNTGSGRCLNVNGGNAPYFNGQEVMLYDCVGAGNMKFSDIETAYNTQWITINVDPNGDGAATTKVGPGSVNLVTGDHTVSATDIDEFGLSVNRNASSRDPNAGWLAQGERLSDNQQRLNTDLSGFDAYNATIGRATTQGHASSTDSLEIHPLESGGTSSGPGGDTFVAVGGDGGAMRLGMRPGKRYRFSGWIYVPSSTGLALPAGEGKDRGQRITAFLKTPAGYQMVASPQASFMDGWQQLTLDFTVPADATEAFIRLYNGQPVGAGQFWQVVWWDDMSFKELVAPFGPQWTGGITDDGAGSDYTILEVPSVDLVKVNTASGDTITFGKGLSGAYFPEPGAETLTLVKESETSFLLSEPDGTKVQFTKQEGSTAFVVTSTWNGEGDVKRNSTTTYVYDLTDNRALVKKAIAPTEVGVGECNAQLPAKGCAVLEYDYATVSTATASVFGDIVDQVRSIKLWSWNPDAGAVQSIEVATYLYDTAGRLRQVVDPRVSALVTSYDYNAAGMLTVNGAPGQLPLRYEHGSVPADAEPAVGSPRLNWAIDAGSGTSAADSSGNNRHGTAANTSWVTGAGSTDPADKALQFNGNGVVVGPNGVLNTAQSYTVSAWARLDSNGDYAIAVTQDGSRQNAFALMYAKPENRWTMTTVSGDVDNATVIRAMSSAPPARGQWTHLTGVFDQAAGKIKLYVNGRLEGTANATGWASSGAFRAGHGMWNGTSVAGFRGGVDDVRAYAGVLSDTQIGQLAAMRYVDTSAGYLHRAIRGSLVQGTKDQPGPDNVTRIVYGVPLIRSAGGPQDLDEAAAATWGQTELPTDATAVFGPQDDPTVVKAGPTVPGANGYEFATVHYLNASGQEVNTLTPSANGVTGGYLDSQQYDRYGNVVWRLEATNRLLALGLLPDATQRLGDLEIYGSTTRDRAQQLATLSSYSPDGSEMVEKIGPRTRTVLETPLGGSPAGTPVVGRYRTTYLFDEGKPDGKIYHLVTTETSSLQTAAGDTSIRVRKNGYDPINGSASGWVLGKATKVIGDAGAGGLNLTTHLVYDTSGRILKSWGVGSNGADAQAQQIVYFTAGPNGDDAACGNRPEWAGKACLTKPIGAITGHDASRMPGTLPVLRVTGYNRYGDLTGAVETNAGKTRTTTKSYDASGRLSSAGQTADDGTVAVPPTVTAYDPENGLIPSTTAGTASATTEYDLLGRVVKYTDADGAVTRSEYNRWGHLVKTVDPTGTITYTYDRALEPREMMTSLTDSTAGTFTAGYSPDGQLTRMTYPGGLTRTDELDTNFAVKSRRYVRDSDQAVVFDEQVSRNVYGQVATIGFSGGRSKTYTYDRQGRLTKAQQVSGNDSCTVRTYEYDLRTNRKKRQAWLPSETGACDETGVADAIDSYVVDSADRLVSDSSGVYTYDAFGRTTVMPGGLTNSFHVNDMVAGQEQGDLRQTWTLDADARLRTSTTETRSGGVWGNAVTKVNHYGNGGDSPGWITENTATGNWTRNVAGPDGNLAITVTQGGSRAMNGANLHGDTAFSYDIDSVANVTFFDYDEFGVETENDPGRYGWIGSEQRSSEAMGGVVLMGTRLYSANLGRFLSIDKVPGGSATAYDYCNADPVNCFDLDGTCPPCAAGAAGVGAAAALLAQILIYVVIALIVIIVVLALAGVLMKIVRAIQMLVLKVLLSLVMAFVRFMNWWNNNWKKFTSWLKRQINKIINYVLRVIKLLKTLLNRIIGWLIREGIARLDAAFNCAKAASALIPPPPIPNVWWSGARGVVIGGGIIFGGVTKKKCAHTTAPLNPK